MSEELRIKLKAAREKLGLSQSQAAGKWGIPLPTLIKWENNLRTPRGFALTALTEKLDAILSSPPPKKGRK
jgi:DNA-binding transcriptional regulator YiaG